MTASARPTERRLLKSFFPVLSVWPSMTRSVSLYSLRTLANSVRSFLAGPLRSDLAVSKRMAELNLTTSLFPSRSTLAPLTSLRAFSCLSM